MSLSMLTLTLALGSSSYMGEETPSYFGRIEVGHEAKNYYAFTAYEDTTLRLLGQPIGDGEIFSVGVGYKHPLSERFYLFGEVGYGVVQENARDIIQQEIVYTEVVGRHHRPFRPLPVYPQNGYDQDSYETLWTLDDGFLGAFGLGYNAKNGFGMTLAYRPFYVKERMELWDEEQRANGGGWWQESRSKNLSAIQASVSWSF